MQKLTGILCMACIMMLFTGCADKGEAEAAGNMLTIGKDGTVVESIVGAFDKEYYGEEDLQEFIQEEVSAYNRTKESDSIRLDKLTVKEETAQMELTYKTSDDYQNFTAYTFFCGTIADAYNAGYDLNVTLQSADGEASVSKTEILQMGGSNIVITEAALNIKTPDNILYISGNVSLQSGKQVKTEGEGLSYIIY